MQGLFNLKSSRGFSILKFLTGLERHKVPGYFSQERTLLLADGGMPGEEWGKGKIGWSYLCLLYKRQKRTAFRGPRGWFEAFMFFYLSGFSPTPMSVTESDIFLHEECINKILNGKEQMLP